METGGWAAGAGGRGAAGVWTVRTALGLGRCQRGHPSPAGILQSRWSPVPFRKKGPDWELGPEEVRDRPFSWRRGWTPAQASCL